MPSGIDGQRLGALRRERGAAARRCRARLRRRGRRRAPTRRASRRPSRWRAVRAAAARAAPGPLCTTQPRRGARQLPTQARALDRERSYEADREHAARQGGLVKRHRLARTDAASALGGGERRRRERQPVGRAREHQAQRAIAHQREIRRQHRRLDGAARHLDLAAGAERRVPMNLAQRQHGKADGPKAEAPNSRLALRNQAGVLERVAQMRVADADAALPSRRETRAARATTRAARDPSCRSRTRSAAASTRPTPGRPRCPSGCSSSANPGRTTRPSAA